MGNARARNLNYQVRNAAAQHAGRYAFPRRNLYLFLDWVAGAALNYFSKAFRKSFIEGHASALDIDTISVQGREA